MNMKARIAILSVILTFATVTSAGAQSSSIFGVYGQCNMACRYIKINPDFTFEELLDGDLFNGQRKNGIWNFISKTKIKAQSHKPSSALNVREKVTGDTKSTVSVLDPNGAAIAHAEVYGISDGKSFKCVTDEYGDCEIPQSPGFDLVWERFRGNYQVKNPAANRFQVELAYEQMDTVIDEVWMIKGNHLYVEYEGAFDKTDPLKKVPLKRARKLFPLKSQTKH